MQWTGLNWNLATCMEVHFNEIPSDLPLSCYLFVQRTNHHFLSLYGTYINPNYLLPL